MHLPINLKSPNNISKWQMEFNSAFKGLTLWFPGMLLTYFLNDFEMVPVAPIITRIIIIIICLFMFVLNVQLASRLSQSAST
jgi:hypothetical protein